MEDVRETTAGIGGLVVGAESLLEQSVRELRQCAVPQQREAVARFIGLLAGALENLEPVRRLQESSSVIEVDEVTEAIEAGLTEPVLAPIDPRAFLASRGVAVTRETQQCIVDETTLWMAKFIGDNYGHLSGLLEIIKRSAVEGRKFKFSLTEKPADISYATQLGVRLFECGFLREYDYNKYQRAIWLSANPDGIVQNFFNGAWFEMYVRLVVEEMLKKHMGDVLDSQVLKGACVTLPDGSDSELDLLVGVDPIRVIWIECKSGRWQDIGDRYKKTGDVLRIDATEAALVLLKSPSATACKTAGSLTDMSVMGIESFRTWFEGTLAEPVLQEPESKAEPGS